MEDGGYLSHRRRLGTGPGEGGPSGDRLAEYRGRLGEEEALAACLLLDEELSMTVERVYSYAQMKKDLDNAQPEAQSMQDRAMGLLFRIQEKTAFLLPELTALDRTGSGRWWTGGRS